MKISTEIGSCSRRVGEEKTVELVAKCGFDAWDFSMFNMTCYDWGKGILEPSLHPLAGENYVKFAKRLRKIGEDNGIVCNQSHAPFPTHLKGFDEYLKRSIECTAIAGGEYCIIHPQNSAPVEQNKEMFLRLLPFAKEYGVKIATENMWNWTDDHASPAACSDEYSFNALLDAVNDDFLTACLDLGHAEMSGLNTSAEKMILALNKRLKCLHIHDNDLKRDSHQIPFSMKIDFEKIVKALKKIDYNGYFTLEADTYLNDFAVDDLQKGLQNMADAAHKLCTMFENL